MHAMRKSIGFSASLGTQGSKKRHCLCQEQSLHSPTWCADQSPPSHLLSPVWEPPLVLETIKKSRLRLIENISSNEACLRKRGELISPRRDSTCEGHRDTQVCKASFGHPTVCALVRSHECALGIAACLISALDPNACSPRSAQASLPPLPLRQEAGKPTRADVLFSRRRLQPARVNR